MISRDRRGVCPIHLLAPVDRQTMEDAEKRSQSLIRRYVIQSSVPINQDTPEIVSEKNLPPHTGDERPAQYEDI